MKPKTRVEQAQRELFRVELEQFVEAGHPLVKLGRQINWTVFAERLESTYAAANGAPGVNTRLLVALHYLKSEHRLERNRLKGAAGDAINAILSVAAMNFQKLQGFFWPFGLRGLDLLWAIFRATSLPLAA